MEEQEFDSEDVREQIEQQRVLAAQLREKLEQDEQQLASKEHQNELLKSKLSLLKSRSKSKRSSTVSEKDSKNAKLSKGNNEDSLKKLEADNVGPKQSHVSTKKGKINILREQLEQNRLRFERHGIELSEDTRSMEAMVEQLRHELEERDVTIQQLQAGQVESDVTSPEELVCDPVDVNTQLLLKEDQVKQLMAQVTDQQNIILELQENLKEKDCVIEARTQAISLLSEDMSKKWRANVDMLEETRQQMQMMQENFVRIEAGLNAEIHQLNQQLENNSKKLSQAEQNVKNAEAARNELALQNAELLKEVKVCKEMPQESSDLEAARSKIDELTQALTEANKLTVKLKAEHKLKVKTLNKQIESLRKESDFSSEVVQLQNHIAELEEDKITQDQKLNDLQKILADLQNEKMAAEKKVAEVEDQLRGMKDQVHELGLKLEKRENEIQDLQQSLKEVDYISKDESANDIKHELDEARSALKELQIRYETLESEKNQRTEAVCLTKSQHILDSGKDLNEQVKGTDHDFVQNTETLRTKLAHYEESLAPKVDMLERTIHEKYVQVQDLETIVQESLEKIDHLTSLSKSEPSCSKCDSMNEELSEKEIVLQKHEAHITELSSSISKLIEENESLKSSSGNTFRDDQNSESQVSEQIAFKQLENSAEDMSNLQRQLIEVSGELELKREECARLESKLKAQVEKSKKIAVNLKAKTVANKDVEDKVGKFESLIKSNKLEIEQLCREKQDMLEKWQSEVSEKDTILNQLAEKLASRELDVTYMREELQSKSSIITELESKLTSLQTHVKDLQLAIDEKCEMIASFHNNAQQSHQVEDEKVSELQAEIVSLQTNIASLNEEKLAAVTKLESFTKQAKIKLAKEKKMRTELLEKQSELEALLVERNNTLAEVKESHDKETGYLVQEKERMELLMQELQNQVTSLHQELECERNKVQYGSENVLSVEEQTEETQDLNPLTSIETFQGEVEDLCLSITCNSPLDVIPILEEEKVKTLNELNSSFESIHNQIITRLYGRPDLLVDRKLLTELKNLMTRVVNRSLALAEKIKNLVAESQYHIQEKLQDADRSIQTLENSLVESRKHLDLKESEKLNLEDAVNNLNKERSDLIQQMEAENQKLRCLESEFRENKDRFDSVVESTNLLQKEVNDKQVIIQDLEARCQALTVQNEGMQHELQNLHQKNSDLQLALEEQVQNLHQKNSELQSTLEEQVQNLLQKNSDLQLTVEEQLISLQSFQNVLQNYETLKTDLLTKDQNLEKSMQNIMELESLLDETRKRCEVLQHQTDESCRNSSEMQLQLQNASQRVENLQQQLEDSLQENVNLRQGQETYAQHISSWSFEKQQYEEKISELLKQLEEAPTSLGVNSSRVGNLSEISEANEAECLRQQLTEKTAEVENYQRRLIQLQMGASDSTPVVSGSLNDMEQAQSFDVISQSQSDVNSPYTMLEAFKPVEFSEVNKLQETIQSMNDRIESLLSEKKSLENEKINLQTDIDLIKEQLNAAQNELKTSHLEESKVNDLQQKISELTDELNWSQTSVEQEKFNANKLADEIKALQWKLENETFAKEKALQVQKKTEDRPCIPKTLDTHVSSLQDSGSTLETSPSGAMDESLMEKNMTELESELRGMVSSQHDVLKRRETASKEQRIIQSNVENIVEQEDVSKFQSVEGNTHSLLGDRDELQKKISQLEEERDLALAQVQALQAEIKTLSESLPEKVTSGRQKVISISDTLMSEDDSWGWGVDSASELQHQEQKNLNEPLSNDLVNDLQTKINSLSIENSQLETDKHQLTEDLKASQIRAAKLTRKLRDLKAKYDEISEKNRSADSPFDSLDQTIEEERMKQMQGLERELKEIQTELLSVKTERDKLQKQVDVFSSANERMLEAKERQDLEVEMWQKRSKDLTNQVQALEWKIRDLEEGKDGKPIHEVVVKSESQTLEKSSQPPESLNPVEIDQLLKENHTWSSNYENLMQEYQKLRAQCLADSEQRTQIDALIAQQKGIIDRLEHEKTYFQDVYDSLKMDYEAACDQLASKQAGQDSNVDQADETARLEEKLMNVEKQLEETLTQLQIVSSDNVEFQAQCSELSNARKQLMHQLDESQEKLKANAQEIHGLQATLRHLENRSLNETSSPNYSDHQESIKLSNELTQASHKIDVSSSEVSNASQAFDTLTCQESTLQGSSPGSSLLNWSEVVAGGEPQSVEVFDIIASNTAQGLEEQLRLKENELHRERRMIETLKRTHEEAEHEWGQIIEYHKSQLETAKNTIIGLQAELESLRICAENTNEAHSLQHNISNQSEENQQLHNVIFAKEKEIECLQISLAVSKESRKKLEQEWQMKEAELNVLISQIPQTVDNSQSLQEAHSTYSEPSKAPSHIQASDSSISTYDRNLTSELDQALCMLHERDIRCEELTLELTRLLEERDALQLRLSNAIRTNEELREKLKHLLPTQSYDISQHTVPTGHPHEYPVSSVVDENSSLVPSSADETSGNTEEGLEKKLAELRKIGYNHDKSLRDDREYRHQQQMRLMSPASPSQPAVSSGDASDVEAFVEVGPQPQGSPITESSTAEESTSNESQGSLLSWFWGRN